MMPSVGLFVGIEIFNINLLVGIENCTAYMHGSVYLHLQSNHRSV